MSSFITPSSGCLLINRRSYLNELDFATSRIKQDKNIEQSTLQEYSGRELYEMIQNADDEQSSRLELELTRDGHLHIRNWGDRPFTEGGLLSIMRSHLSTKSQTAYCDATIRPIGHKGLGFRSLLNWSDEITIHSNGVSCSFSAAIARQYWQEIKQEARLDEAVATLFEEASPGGLPLPILAIPRVSRDNLTAVLGETDGEERCTTDVEVHCKNPTVRADIVEKLEHLPCSVLLFLNFVREISIRLPDGRVRTLAIESVKELPTGDDCLWREVTIASDSTPHVYTVCLRRSHLSSGERYEVGVAWPHEPHQDQGDSVLYSYFPTNVRLSLPAIYHGTFQLDSSRNHLIRSAANDELLTALGQTALALARYLAQTTAERDGDAWQAFELVNMTSVDAKSRSLAPLAETIAEGIQHVPLLPTVGGGHSVPSTCVFVSDAVGAWLAHRPTGLPHVLASHLLPDSQAHLRSECNLSLSLLTAINRTTDQLHDAFEALAASCPMTIEERAGLIVALTKAGGCMKKLSILVDEGGNIIKAQPDELAHVMCMEEGMAVPACLNMQCVHQELAERLKNAWSCEIRDVTNQLSKIAFVTNGDVAGVKRKMESWSRVAMDAEGMKQALAWLYARTRDSSAPSEPLRADMCLISRAGERRPVCQMLLQSAGLPPCLDERVADEWWLMGSLSDWKEWLVADTEADAAYFLYHMVGVSRCVPHEQVYFGNCWNYLEEVRDDNNKRQIDNRFCDNFPESNKANKEYNYAFVPCEPFLGLFSLCDILGLLLTDERAIGNLNSNYIHLFYRTLKMERVSLGYAAWRLRGYDCLASLRNCVVGAGAVSQETDYRYLHEQYGKERTSDVDPLLLRLGAHESLTAFSLEQLYGLMPGPQDPRGVQRRYRELREAIREKGLPDDEVRAVRDRLLTHVYARQGGTVAWRPVSEVYYWDNDQLPRGILDTLPKLEIGNRVGEESVRTVFGVRLAKDISIEFASFVANETLTRQLRDYVAERITYLLVYRMAGTREVGEAQARTFCGSLRFLCSHLFVYSQCQYRLEGRTGEMDEGDMLTTRQPEGPSFHICSSHASCAAAITDPRFCENLNETICMTLRVVSADMASVFRNIMTHDLGYIDYIRRKDLSPELWNMAQAIENGQPVADDEAEAASRRAGTMESLCAKYAEMGKRVLYHEAQTALQNRPDEALAIVHAYYEQCRSLSNAAAWRTELEGKARATVLTEAEQEALVGQRVQAMVRLDGAENMGEVPLHIYPEYEAILAEHHITEGALPSEDVVIGKFPGLEQLFRQRVEAAERNEQAAEGAQSGTNDETDEPEIAYGTAQTMTQFSPNASTDAGRKRKNGGYASDKSKFRAGQTAEEAVYKAMRRHADLFADVHGHSRILNPETGDDGLHYDMTYRRVDPETHAPSGELRYLEVKSMSQNSILMSHLEYEFAQDHKAQYDLALYHEGRVTLLDSPFQAKEGRQPLKAVPETYQLWLEVDEKEFRG